MSANSSPNNGISGIVGVGEGDGEFFAVGEDVFVDV
jgi:hypothetical protein